MYLGREVCSFDLKASVFRLRLWLTTRKWHYGSQFRVPLRHPLLREEISQWSPTYPLS